MNIVLVNLTTDVDADQLR